MANRKYVVAENVKEDLKPNFHASTEFDFPCPNCGKRHWMQERMLSRRLRHVSYKLACGNVRVHMPWWIQKNQEILAN